MLSERCFERDLVGDTSAHEQRAVTAIVSCAKEVAASRRNRALALALLAAALAWGPYVLVVIPAAFTLLMIVALATGGARRTAARRTAPIALPDPFSYCAPEAQGLIKRLSLCRKAVRDAFRAGPKGPAFSLASILKDVPRLERRVIVLVARVEYVARCLMATSALPGDSGERPQVGEDKPSTAGNAPGRAEARRRVAAERASIFEEKKQKALEMSEDILIALEALPARIARIQFMRMEACDDGVAQDIVAASSGIETFESELLLDSSDNATTPPR